ncbi:hypothetical protein B9Z19DRAFT_1137167 [Tuber borchii]|uniref:Uncharacterized protein n=1 Tax=Tuber borchii TaxID=42251 RepID=A0A2T6ZAS3_TUBBO|nr:hypothetical protein B9Z19DRAFT_1137167 [Tuber borchii]
MAAGDYETLKEMYSQFWNNPTAAEYLVCETSQASPLTDDAYRAVDNLNSFGSHSCCQLNALQPQCSTLPIMGRLVLDSAEPIRLVYRVIWREVDVGCGRAGG